MSYRISTVSELTGIPIGTITAWERRYGLLHPARAIPSGYRLYSDEDVALLRRIRRLLDAGHKISEAIANLDAPEDALLDLRAQLKHHLLHFDRPAADALRQRLVMVPFRHAIDRVYLPLLVEIGDGWARGAVSIAQEHHASTWCRDQLVGMLLALGGEHPGGMRVLCAGFPGERHEIGILAVAVKLGLVGHRVSYFGADLPQDEIVSASAGSDLVCISCLGPLAPARIRTVAEQMVSRLAPGAQLVLGGPSVAGVAPVPGVWLTPRFEDLEARLAEAGRAAQTG